MHKTTARYIVTLLSLLSAAVVMAYSPSHYSASSILADGHWVKIAVDTTGIYEISETTLRQMGFGKPADVNVYGYGGVLAHNPLFDDATPDALPLCPSVHTDDGRLVFYAEGTVRAVFKGAGTSAVEIQRNHYDRRGYYFLSDRSTAASLPKTSYIVASSAPLDSHQAIALIENEVTGYNGGVMIHDADMPAGSRRRYDFRLRDYASGQATYRIATAANSRQNMTFSLTFSDNVAVSELSEPKVYSNTSTAILYNEGAGTASLCPGAGYNLSDDIISVSVGVPEGIQLLSANVDNSYIIYPRLNIINADESELMLNYPTAGDANIAVEGADSDCRIWDVTDPAAVVVLGTSSDGTRIVATPAPGSGMRRLVAFNPGARHRQISSANVLPRRNIHGQPVPDMVIVTIQSLRDAAEDLAGIHRRHGLDILIVEQQEAFDEFGSGAATPTAIRRMIKMFYDRNPAKMKYVLLYGLSTCDSRAIYRPAGDYLLTHQCEIRQICRDDGANYGTDLFFGMLRDEYNPALIEREPMQVSVGRLSPKDNATGIVANAKIDKFLSSPPPPANMLRILRSSDNDNNAVHLFHAACMTDSMLRLNDRLTITRADVPYYPVVGNKSQTGISLVRNTLNRGAGYFHYNGHGSATGLSGEGIYSVGDARDLSYRYPPLMMFSSCSGYPFDLKSASLAEDAVLNPNGGAIGCIAAGRSVYLDFNRILSDGVSRTYAVAKHGWSGADILRHARQYLLDKGKLINDAGNNALCFNYAGDPALGLPFAQYNIDITLPGKGILSSHTPIQLKAAVTDADGKTLRDFNGTAFIEVYDGSRTCAPLINVPGVDSEVFDDYLMAEFPATVTNGLISATLTLPDAYNGSGGYRVAVTACADDRRTAAGIAKGLAITPPPADAGPADNTPAEIMEFAIDPAAYITPETVAPDFSLHAIIDPSPSGIAMGNTGVRGKLNITLDGTQTFPDLQYQIDYDSAGLAHVGLKLDNISPGPHILRLTVPNNAGQTVEAYLNFNVQPAALGGKLILNGPNPVRDKAVLGIEADGKATRLLIVDADGETIRSIPSPQFPYTWTLTDSTGRRVADGVYRAWAILDSVTAQGATEALELTIIK